MSIAQFLQILFARIRLAIAIFLVTVLSAYGISKLMTKQYTATTTLIVDFQGMDPITGAVINAQQLLPGYMATQVDVIQSHAVALRVVDENRLADNPDLQAAFQDKTEGKGSLRDWVADLILDNIKVEPSKQSNVILVSYTATDPEFAATIANSFVSSFLATNLELRTFPARQNAAWFEQQMKVLREDLEQKQARLSEMQQKKGIFASENPAHDIENARLAELSTQLVLAQAKTSEALSHQQELRDARAAGRSLESLPEVIGNHLIVNLKTSIAAAESKLADLTERTGVNHPQVLSARSELASLKEKLRLELSHVINGINTEVQIAQQRENQLKAAVMAERQRVLELGNKRDEVAVLTREMENAQKAYDDALQRFSQTRLQGEVNQTNIAVLNPAVPPLEPSHPRTLLNVALAGLVGGLLALMAVFGLELMDRRVRGIEDLEFALDLPVLGLMPGNTEGSLPKARALEGSPPIVGALPWNRA